MAVASGDAAREHVVQVRDLDDLDLHSAQRPLHDGAEVQPGRGRRNLVEGERPAEHEQPRGADGDGPRVRGRIVQPLRVRASVAHHEDAGVRKGEVARVLQRAGRPVGEAPDVRDGIAVRIRARRLQIDARPGSDGHVRRRRGDDAGRRPIRGRVSGAATRREMDRGTQCQDEERKSLRHSWAPLVRHEGRDRGWPADLFL